MADDVAPANGPAPQLPALPPLPALQPAPATVPATPPALPVVQQPPALPVVQPPPLPPAAPQVTFFVAEDGKPIGPLTLDQVGAEITAKRVTGKSLVWKSGDPAWVPAEQLAELKPVLGNVPPPVPEDDKWTRFMIGTWQAVINTVNSGQRFTQTYVTQFRPDGSLAGVVTFSINGMPGQSQPLSGTWEVKAIAGDQFTLIEHLPGQGDATAALRRLTDNDLANDNEGYQAHRVGG